MKPNQESLIIKKLDALHRELETKVNKDDLKNFLTKDDAKNFATKDDLKGFATKDDLKGFATKDDLKGFATKDDLKGFATNEKFDRLAAVVVTNSANIEEIKRTMATKQDIYHVLNRIDHFAKRIDVYSKKAIVHDYRLNQLESLTDNHEKRMAALEVHR